MKKTFKNLLAAAPMSGRLADKVNKGTFENLLQPVISPRTSDPKELVVNVINYLLFFLGVIAIAMIVWGGIQFLTSGGDAEKTTKARNTLLYAVIGIIIIVLAFAIVNWAKNQFA